MINLFNIMNSVEEEEIALKKVKSILEAVSDSIQYSPNCSDIYVGAICAAVDICLLYTSRCV